MEVVIASIGTMDNPLTWIIIAGVILLLFGGGKLKEFGKSLGEGINEFKKATTEPAKQEPAKEEAAKEPAATTGTTKES